MGRTLVTFDTDQIKSYVFATGVLKEIRGASAILDGLNRKRLFDEVRKIDQTAKLIYANGGSGMFEVDSDTAELCIAAVEKLYQLETITGSISGALMEDDKARNFQEKLKLLNYRLRVQKEAKAISIKPATHSYLRTCDSCGEEYAVYKEQDEVICSSCHQKRAKDRNIKTKITETLENQRPITETYEIWDWLLDKLRQVPHFNLANKKRSEEFEDLGHVSSPANYMGLIYADGNGMGDKLLHLTSQDEIKKFSKIVDEGMKEAVLAAIDKHLHPKGNLLPFDILLLGGDDLVMVTAADQALETALTIMNRFQNYTQSQWREPLTLSVGVAIAHAKFPFGNLLKLAEDLLKFAKKERAKRAWNGQQDISGLINFQVVSASNSLRFSEDYKRVFETQADNRKFIRTFRPYDFTTMEKLIKLIRDMKSESFPRNKLQALQESIFLDYGNSMLQALTIQARMKPGQREMLKRARQEFSQENGLIPMPPWIQRHDKHYTPFLDIAELYDFIH